MARHNSHFGLASDDTRAISTDHPRLGLRTKRLLNHDLITLRDTLGDGHDERDLGFDRLEDGRSATGRWNVNDRRVGFRITNGIPDGTPDGQSQVLGAGLFGVDTTDIVGTEFERLLGVEGAGLAGETLDEDASRVV